MLYHFGALRDGVIIAGSRRPRGGSAADDPGLNSLTRSPSRPGMSAFCAQRTAGVDVERT